ncbi:MAG: trehalose-phosphatase [Halofilum sp. (in: g-proteobacteria)]|nr:trehalose-phosphatase [Halofilum sp. (in: g-proteobacteria)]
MAGWALLAPRRPWPGHGLERRGARGMLPRREARALAQRGAAIALRGRPGAPGGTGGRGSRRTFPRAPQHADEVRAFLDGQRDALGTGYHVQSGKAVLELKPVGRDKGRVVADFMREAPFAGRIPVFVGDDRTDEDAFAWVNAHGGVSIRVGDAQGPTRATYRLESVTAALRWLDDVAAALSAGDGQGGARA